MEKENKEKVYFKFGSEEELKKFKERSNITEKQKVILFIRDRGGTIKSSGIKEEILKEYCKENKLHIIKTLHCFITYADDFSQMDEQINLISNELEEGITLLVYDMFEFANKLKHIYIVSKLLEDKAINIVSMCEGNFNKDFYFEDNIKMVIKQQANS